MKQRKTTITLADPNVDEIRAIRAELSQRFGNDIDRLGERLRDVEARYRHRITRPREGGATGSRRGNAAKRG